MWQRRTATFQGAERQRAAPTSYTKFIFMSASAGDDTATLHTFDSLSCHTNNITRPRLYLCVAKCTVFIATGEGDGELRSRVNNGAARFPRSDKRVTQNDYLQRCDECPLSQRAQRWLATRCLASYFDFVALSTTLNATS